MDSSVSGCSNTVIETLHLDENIPRPVDIQTTEEFHHGETFRRYFSPGMLPPCKPSAFLNLECTKLKW